MRMSNNYQEGDEEATVQEKHQVLGFVDENPVHTIGISSMNDPTMHYETFSDASLTDFFERPIRIRSFSWAVGATFNESFNPWEDYFSVTSVAKKLDNYYMMRANLHIKVMINGTPFHYSRLIVSYNPLSEFNTNHDPYVFDVGMDLLKMSMMPHGFVDPSVQSPLEMELPFMSPFNYITCLDMISQSVGRPKTVMGSLMLRSTDQLQAVSATAASSIPVVVFAWATDVELAIPTSSIVSAGKKKKRKPSVSRPPKQANKSVSFGQRMKTAASDKVAALSQVSIPPDEAKDGLISSVSSVVANVAGRLTDVPFIGDAAKMTKGVANGVTKLARFFGYGRPAVMTDPMYYKNLPFSSTAMTQGNETVSKLAFDPKQAVTDDPAVSAMGCEDELALSMFTNKESLIATVLWDSADLADAELFWANVTPSYTRQRTETNGISYQLSSLAFAADPFKYWSGSIMYRFQFVASAFHTGRVRISFEPDGALYDPESFNTTYSQVVDLSTGTDVTFIVPWSQNVPYKKVPTTWYNQMFLPPSGVANYDEAFCNGKIYVTVLNELISPDALKGISINVFVRAGDDFELAVPRDPTPVNDRPSMSLYGASGEGNKSLLPEKISMLFGEPLTGEEIQDKNSVFFGEVVTSFRPLLKRYEYAGTRCTPDSTNYTDMWRATIAGMVYPPRYGHVTSTVTTGTYSQATDGVEPRVDYNFNPTPLMNYLGSAFIGVRGAVRWKFIPTISAGQLTSISAGRGHGSLTINSNTDLIDMTSIQVLPQNGGTTANGEYTQNRASIWEGSVVYPCLGGQPGVEIEIPWYNPLRFASTDINSFGTSNEDLGDDFSNSTWNLTGMAQGSGDSTFDSMMSVETYVAAGEDFTFNCYMGPPVFYVDNRTWTPV